MINSPINKVEFIVLKDSPIGRISNLTSTANTISMNVLYTDPDYAISGAVDLELYEGATLVDSINIDLAIDTLITFNTAINQGTVYNLRLVANDYNLNNGLLPTVTLAEDYIETKTSNEIILDLVTIENISTSTSTVTNATFSGLGLSNLDHGNVVVTRSNQVFVDDIIIALTVAQINEIKAGQLLTPVNIGSLSSNSGYEVTFELLDINNNKFILFQSPLVRVQANFIT